MLIDALQLLFLAIIICELGLIYIRMGQKE
jgi:hypothetical protein